MRGTVLYGPRDIRFEDRAEPTIINPTEGRGHRPADDFDPCRQEPR